MRLTQKLNSNFSWDWADGGCVLLHGDHRVGFVPTQTPSKTGADLVGLAMHGDHAQISYHGCDKYSIQVWQGKKLIHDIDIF